MTNPVMKSSFRHQTRNVSAKPVRCSCVSSEVSGDLRTDERDVLARRVERLGAEMLKDIHQGSLHQAESRELVGCCCSLKRQKRRDQKADLDRSFSSARPKTRSLEPADSSSVQSEDFDHRVETRFIPYALSCLVEGGAEMLSVFDPDRAKWYRSFANLALLPIRTVYTPQERGSVQSVYVSSEDLGVTTGGHPALGEPSFVAKPIKIVQPKKARFKTKVANLMRFTTSKCKQLHQNKEFCSLSL